MLIKFDDEEKYLFVFLAESGKGGSPAENSSEKDL